MTVALIKGLPKSALGMWGCDVVENRHSADNKNIQTC